MRLIEANRTKETRNTIRDTQLNQNMTIHCIELFFAVWQHFILDNDNGDTIDVLEMLRGARRRRT
jgi:hypothetical protein